MSRDPRYQQESFVPWVNLGETPMEVPLPVWNLDGVSWSDAPPPARRHQHWAQTIGRADTENFKRCPCGATWTPLDGWYSRPRTQPDPELPGWLARLDEPAIAGLYLAFIDMWRWIRAPFRKARR